MYHPPSRWCVIDGSRSEESSSRNLEARLCWFHHLPFAQRAISESGLRNVKIHELSKQAGILLHSRLERVGVVAGRASHGIFSIDGPLWRIDDAGKSPASLPAGRRLFWRKKIIRQRNYWIVAGSGYHCNVLHVRSRPTGLYCWTNPELTLEIDSKVVTTKLCRSTYCSVSE